MLNSPPISLPNESGMSHAPSQIFIHLVFATKDRRSLIHSIDETGTYLFAVAKHNKSQLLASGGMPDHLHLLLTLPPTISLAELVSKLKANSSRWLSQQTGKFAA